MSIRGSGFAQLGKGWIRHTKHGRHLVIPTAGGDKLLPIRSEHHYIGVVISYKAFERSCAVSNPAILERVPQTVPFSCQQVTPNSKSPLSVAHLRPDSLILRPAGHPARCALLFYIADARKQTASEHRTKPSPYHPRIQ